MNNSSETSERCERWYVVSTKPRAESKAAKNLVNQGYDIYLPLLRTRRSSEPLFPGYLFVRQEQNINVMPINYTPGVNTIVRFGNKLADVEGDAILNLKDSEAVFTSAHGYQAGETVEIVDGPFKHLLGAFSQYGGFERVKILIEWLGGKRVVDIPEVSVRSA